jgi:hypothetical protein
VKQRKRADGVTDKTNADEPPEAMILALLDSYADEPDEAVIHLRDLFAALAESVGYELPMGEGLRLEGEITLGELRRRCRRVRAKLAEGELP